VDAPLTHNWKTAGWRTVPTGATLMRSGVRMQFLPWSRLSSSNSRTNEADFACYAQRSKIDSERSKKYWQLPTQRHQFFGVHRRCAGEYRRLVALQRIYLRLRVGVALRHARTRTHFEWSNTEVIIIAHGDCPFNTKSTSIDFRRICCTAVT
jgi:hypothetical protein